MRGVYCVKSLALVLNGILMRQLHHHAGGVWKRLLIRNVRGILTALSADRRLFRVPSDYDLWTNFKHVEAILKPSVDFDQR